MFKRMILTLGFVAIAGAASASVHLNGFQPNALTQNALTQNGRDLNALTKNGRDLNALSNNALVDNGVRYNGTSVDPSSQSGLRVLAIELPAGASTAK